MLKSRSNARWQRCIQRIFSWFTPTFSWQKSWLFCILCIDFGVFIHLAVGLLALSSWTLQDGHFTRLIPLTTAPRPLCTLLWRQTCSSENVGYPMMWMLLWMDGVFWMLGPQVSPARIDCCRTPQRAKKVNRAHSGNLDGIGDLDWNFRHAWMAASIPYCFLIAFLRTYSAS